MRVNDTVYRRGINFNVVGIERLPITFQNPNKPVPIGSCDQLFGQRRHGLLRRNRARISQPLRERAGESAHLVAAPFTFLDTHSHAHKLVGPAEMPVRWSNINYISDHTTAVVDD